MTKNTQINPSYQRHLVRLMLFTGGKMFTTSSSQQSDKEVKSILVRPKDIGYGSSEGLRALINWALDQFIRLANKKQRYRDFEWIVTADQIEARFPEEWAEVECDIEEKKLKRTDAAKKAVKTRRGKEVATNGDLEAENRALKEENQKLKKDLRLAELARELSNLPTAEFDKVMELMKRDS